MGVYVGDKPFTGGSFAGKAITSIYLGGTKVWPTITFPYVVQDTILTDAQTPPGTTGAWVTLHGVGQNGVGGDTRAYSTAGGSDGVGGGAGGFGSGAIPRVFVHAAYLGATFTLANDDPGARFSTGGVSLVAKHGSQGGGASASGLPGAVAIARDNPGAGYSGGDGGGVQFSSDGSGGGSVGLWPAAGSGASSPVTVPVSGVKPSGGGGASGSYDSNYLYGGHGGGGGGAWPGKSGYEGGAGGAGIAKVEFINTPVVMDQTFTFSTAGAWSFPLPLWVKAGDQIDVVAVPGGAGGANGTLAGSGAAGKAGSIVSATMTAGTGIAITGTLSGQVGAGGASNNGAGGSTTCTQAGLTATGGSGTGSPQTPVSVTVNGVTYTGDGAGKGGNGGAALFGAGAAGAAGKVYIRVKQ